MNLNPKKWGWSWWKINGEATNESRIAVMSPTREMLKSKLEPEYDIPFPEPTLEDLNRMCIEAVQKRDPSLPF